MYMWNVVMQAGTQQLIRNYKNMSGKKKYRENNRELRETEETEETDEWQWSQFENERGRKK